MQIRTKSTIKSTTNQAMVLSVLALLLLVVQAQPDCSARTFPAKIPMRKNQSLLINLHQYFDGNNMSFTVLPSNTRSYVDEIFQCRDIAYHNIGKVVSSEYYSRDDAEVIGVLAQSAKQLGKYAFHYIQIDKLTVTTLNITVDKISNCNAFLLDFINETYFEITVNCKYTASTYTYGLVSTVATLNTYQPKWTLTQVPLFTYTPGLSMQFLLVKDILFRAVISTSNSYIQIWNWKGEERTIIGLIDKTFLGLDVLNIKQMRYYGSSLVLLDFMHGIYVVRFGNSQLFTLVAHFQQPFYDGFEYNEVSGQLNLFKKGKIDTVIVQNIQNSNLAVGKSYNLNRYEPILKVISWDDKLIVLSSNYIHQFAQAVDSYSVDYNIYSARNTINLFVRDIDNQPFTLLRLYNNKELVSYSSCTVRTPFLHLSEPEETQLITVTGVSTINDESAFCRQSFTIQKIQQQRALIYDNGYQADNEIIFSNLPGESTIDMSRYGTAKNLTYQVLENPASRIEYQTTVNKLKHKNCSIVTKPIPLGGSIYSANTWLQLLIIQMSNDNSLRYFLCNNTQLLSCISAYEQLSLQPITLSAYELIQQNKDFTVSFQAIVQQKKFETEIIIRKLVILQPSKQLVVGKYCSIILPDRIQEYNNITQLDIVNGKLFVLLRYRKEILIYSLNDVSCSCISNITARSFPGEYFSPNNIYFSKNQHQTLLVRQWNELLTIRLYGVSLNRAEIVGRIGLPESSNGSLVLTYSYAIYLSLVNNKVLCYRWDDSGKLSFQRELNLDGMKLTPMRKTQQSYYKLLDSKHLAVYLLDPKTKLITIKIFAFTQLISIANDYIYTTLEKDDQLAVFAYGGEPQSKNIISLQLLNGPSLSYFICRCSQTHLTPSIKFNFRKAYYPVEKYTESVTVMLSTQDDLHAHHFRISLSNIGSGISKGNRFPGRGTNVNVSEELIIDDRFWFSGSIYNYSVECDDCGDRIKFTQKMAVDHRQTLQYSTSTLLDQEGDVVWFMDKQFVVALQENYSIWPLNSTATGYQLKSIQTVSLNSHQCLDSKSAFTAIISLCWRINLNDQKEYYLTLTSTASFKGFILDEITMQFQPNAIPKMLLNDDIIVVYSQKIAVLYTVWEVQQNIRFIELDRIDGQDISTTICSLQLLSNNTAPNTDITKILYTVMLTLGNSEIYYDPFQVFLEEQQVIDQEGNLKIVRFPNVHSNPMRINLMKVWTQRHIQIPSDAKIVSTITRKQTSLFDEQEILTFIVIFDMFHTYQFRIVLSKTSKITKGISLQAVYYKFGSNLALSASLGDYLVIKYTVNTDPNRTTMVFGCFDLKEYTNNTEQIREHYTFAAYTASNMNPLDNYGLNWRYKSNKILYINGDSLQFLNVNNQLIAHVSGLYDEEFPLYSQKMVIYKHNPIDSRTATIQLNSVDLIVLSGLQIALIVIGSIAFVVLFVVGGRIAVRKIKNMLKMVELVQNEKAEEALLEIQDQQKIDKPYEVRESGMQAINQSQRGSIEP